MPSWFEAAKAYCGVLGAIVTALLAIYTHGTVAVVLTVLGAVCTGVAAYHAPYAPRAGNGPTIPSPRGRHPRA